MSSIQTSSCPKGSKPRKYRCPINGINYPSVSPKTMFHHLSRPWAADLKSENYYYCDDPNCDVIYFGQDDDTISIAQIRTVVGAKEKTENGLICYCFGISKREAAASSKTKAYVVKQTKDNECACEVRNPFGRCCLKDFP
jgi:hypothetical protein